MQGPSCVLGEALRHHVERLWVSWCGGYWEGKGLGGSVHIRAWSRPGGRGRCGATPSGTV